MNVVDLVILRGNAECELVQEALVVGVVEVLPLFATVEVLLMVAGVILHVVIAHAGGGHHLEGGAFHLGIIVVEATVGHHHHTDVLAVFHHMQMEFDAANDDGAFYETEVITTSDGDS